MGMPTEELALDEAAWQAAQKTGRFEGTLYDWRALDQKDRQLIMDGKMTSRLASGGRLSERIISVPQPGVKSYSHNRWQKMLEEMFEEIEHLAKAKGGEYSGDVDRLMNFRRNAAALGLPMETIWGVYAAKHWDAIMQYIRDLRENKTRERMEPISGRIKDLIVYLLLLNAMEEERD